MATIIENTRRNSMVKSYLGITTDHSYIASFRTMSPFLSHRTKRSDVGMVRCYAKIRVHHGISSSIFDNTLTMHEFTTSFDIARDGP